MQFGYRQEQMINKGYPRYGIVVFLPEDLQKLVRPIRERFDPDYSLIPPNMALVAPFATELTLDEISQVIAREVAGTVAPTVELSSIGDYYPTYPLIFWQVKPNPIIDRLYKNLYSSLDLALPYRQFSPHVTVAREISNHRVMLVKEKIYPYLPEESFRATTVDLVAPVAQERWVSIRTFRFRLED